MNSEDLEREIDDQIAANSDQGGESWLKAREGKITASEVHRIMGDGKRDMTPEELAARPKSGTGSKSKTIEDPTVLSDAAITYLCEKAYEITSGQRLESAETFAMKWGTEQEPEAREAFKKQYKKELDLRGFIRWAEEPNFAGGSSDGVVVGEKAIIEIKCPSNGGNHIAYSRIRSAEQLPTAYYWQIRMNMLLTDSDKAYFISYDCRQKTEKTQLKVLEIQRDAEAEQRLKIKLRAAIFMLQEIVADFLNQK